MLEVLQKIIASSGHSSRRQASKLIEGGKVKINNKIAKLGDRADAMLDKITINGKVLTKAPAKVYLKLNKPIGYTCSNRLFPGEKNIFELIKNKERLFSIGRLDKNSRGLIILTNDGDLSQKLTHPKFGHEKKYLVKIKEDLNTSQIYKVIQQLQTGVDIGEGDGQAKARKVLYLKDNIFQIILTEGKKRQIRRMFKTLNLTVIDLQRIEFANIKLSDLKEGKVNPLSRDEIDIITK